MTVKTIDDIGTNLLVRLDDFSEVFGIKLGGKGGRFDDVDEHHRELATFGVCGARCAWWRDSLHRQAL